jgi:hypothetical protein
MPPPVAFQAYQEPPFSVGYSGKSTIAQVVISDPANRKLLVPKHDYVSSRRERVE